MAPHLRAGVSKALHVLRCREEGVHGGGVGKPRGMGWVPALVERKTEQQAWPKNLLRVRMSLCRKAEEGQRCRQPCLWVS